MRIAAKSMPNGSGPLQPGDAQQSSVPFGSILASTSWASVRGIKTNTEGSGSRSNSNENMPKSDTGQKLSASMTPENPSSPITTLTAPAELPASERLGDPQKDLRVDGATSAIDESIDEGATAGRAATEPKVDVSRQQAPPTSNQTDTPEFQAGEVKPIEGGVAGADQFNPLSTASITSAAGAAFASAVVSAAEGITQFGNVALNGSTTNSSAIAGSGNAGQQTIKSAQNKNSGMVLSADSESATPAVTAKWNLAAGGEASSNGGQSNGQGSQHAGTGFTAPLASPTAASTSAVFATSTMMLHATSHQTSFPDGVRKDIGGSSLPADPSGSASSDQLNSSAATALGGINTARLIQSMSESEMCVGMHSVEFGEISVRTSVSQQQLLAQISTEHVDLGAAISAHIPWTQEKLGSDYGLHASIQVNHGGASFSDQPGQSSQRDPRATVLALEPVSSVVPAEIERLAARVSPTIGDGYRLDIRA